MRAMVVAGPPVFTVLVAHVAAARATASPATAPNAAACRIPSTADRHVEILAWCRADGPVLGWLSSVVHSLSRVKS